MDLYVESGRISGLTGVFEHILDGVLRDPRWVLRWGGWNANGTVRTLDLVFVGDNRKPAGQITIHIEEFFFCMDDSCPISELHLIREPIPGQPTCTG